MTDVSIAIQHTPDRDDRRAWLRDMTTQLRREDPAVPLVVVDDTERQGCWPTYRRALEAAGRAPHHLVLQDDIQLCRDFLPSVGGAIEARPDSLIALYTNSKKVRDARARHESWLDRLGASGPAVVWPRELIGPFLAWQDRHIDPAFEWDTVRVSIWLIKTATKAFATVPSLVQHLGWDSSTMGLNHPSKVATWFVGDDVSPRDIDWSRGLASPVADTSTGFDETWFEHYRE